MRTRKVILLSLVSAGAAFLFSGCPSQPASPCVIAHSGGSGRAGTGQSYLVQYYLDTDAGVPSAACANASYSYWPTGDFVGGLFVESYGAVTDSLKLVGMVPEEFGWTNPFTGDYVQGSPNSSPPIANDPIVRGNFTTDTQSANGTCIISQQDGGQAVQLFTPSGAPGPQTVTYSINDAVVYTNPAAGEGTQIYYPLTIIRDDGSGNVCVRHYIGVGLWPTALCNVDNDCNPNPQPSNGRPLGSGVLPGIPVTCNLTIGNNDPVLVPDSDLTLVGCNTTPPSSLPFANLSPGCLGPAIDNNNTGGTGVCFFPNPSPTTFPYTN